MGIRKRDLAAVAAALLLGTSASAEEVKVEGVIISSGQGGYNVRTRTGSLTVAMTPSTTVKEQRGLIKRDSDTKSLIPGLIIKIEGDQQGQTVTAEKIEFKERDWRTAVATKAGTTEEFERAAAERAALKQAIIDGNEYVIQAEETVYFAVGKSAVTAEQKELLRELAGKAAGFGNYRVSILGFTDPTGNAAANERLSMQRAMAVSNYLRQTGLIQPGRVLSPSAMGEGTAAPGEAMPTLDEEKRRVVVRIVTPKSQLQ